jgi:O-succinylbenzoate synthase
MREPVVAVDLHRVALPLVHVHRAAHGSEAVRDLILVRVQLAGGSVGWGECSTLARPTYTHEYTAGAWSVLVGELVPSLLDGRLPAVVGHPMASAAVVGALADAVLRRAGRSLAEELAGGAEVRSALERTAVLGLGATPEQVARAVAGGASMVKLKVTSEPGDLAAVLAVRAEHPEVALAVDFNGTATVAALHALRGVGLRYIEQPAPAEALVTSAHLAAAADAPIALDESVTSMHTLDAAVALGAGTVLNVKPARCGGGHLAAALVDRARRAGMEVFVGGMVESGVGRAAALAVAALEGCTLPTDLGPSSAYFASDLTEPLTCDGDGRILVPEGPGIGRVPVPGRLAAATVDHHRAER